MDVMAPTPERSRCYAQFLHIIPGILSRNRMIPMKLSVNEQLSYTDTSMGDLLENKILYT